MIYLEISPYFDGPQEGVPGGAILPPLEYFLEVASPLEPVRYTVATVTLGGGATF